MLKKVLVEYLLIRNLIKRDSRRCNYICSLVIRQTLDVTYPPFYLEVASSKYHGSNSPEHFHTCITTLAAEIAMTAVDSNRY
jgi:hypothetical protein